MGDDNILEVKKMYESGGVGSRGSEGLGALPRACDFPCAIYQFGPHRSFQEMAAVFPEIASLGFDAAQMPPLYPPGKDVFKTADGRTKQGSAYAPRSFFSLAPFMVNPNVKAERYLRGQSSLEREIDDWDKLRGMATLARKNGLKLVGDLVFGHTAADADVIAHFRKTVGEDFYRMKGSDLLVMGSRLENGNRDQWCDVAPIDHAGSRKLDIQGLLLKSLNMMVGSGVSVFRADAAQNMPSDTWAFLIRSSRIFANQNGIDEPLFYADTLCAAAEQDESLVKAGFSCVTDSLRWWRNFFEDWYLRRYGTVRRSGGGSVSFVSNHDTDTFAKTFPDEQERYMRLALTAFMSSSIVVTEGTLGLALEQPSVFLADQLQRGVSSLVGQDFAPAAEKMRNLLSMLILLKKKYSIFRSQPQITLINGEGPLVLINKVSETEEAIIVINPSKEREQYVVPEGFKKGYVFGTNGNWFESSDKRMEVGSYILDRYGLVVFHKDTSPPGTIPFPK